MRRISFLLLLPVCLLMFCGCYHTSATIVDSGELKEYSSFPFPVKFHIEKITHIPAEKNVSPPNKKPHYYYFRMFHREEERWQEGLYKYWPELFSRNPKNALKVRFSLEYRLQEQEERNISGSLSALLLSTLSYGVFPAVWHEKYKSILRVEVEERTKRATVLTVKTRTRGNNAIFGLWGTRYLIPKIPDTLFETNDSWDGIEPHNCRVRDDRLKDFLQLFVAELHSFPPEKIHELYLSRKTEKVKLLE